jgi:CheY-like chemotaxis protein
MHREDTAVALPANASIRALIVDDRPDIRYLARRRLKGLVDEVFEAADGETALHIAREKHPHVVLVDIVLPDINGYELGWHLRAELGPRARMAAMSGHLDIVDKARTMEGAFEQYFASPVPQRALENWLAADSGSNTEVVKWTRAPSGDPASQSIVQSWERSAAAGLRREGRAELRAVPAPELERRLERASKLVRVARPLVDAFLETLPGGTNVVYVTDEDGIVLCSAGDPYQMTLFGLSPGYDWSEKAMGTNGAGTALASGRPVAVVGAQHFLKIFEDCTCTAAPIHGPDGRIVGALDASSSVADAWPERLLLVTTLAARIESELRGIR